MWSSGYLTGRGDLPTPCPNVLAKSPVPEHTADDPPLRIEAVARLCAISTTASPGPAHVRQQLAGVVSGHRLPEVGLAAQGSSSGTMGGSGPARGSACTATHSRASRLAGSWTTAKMGAGTAPSMPTSLENGAWKSPSRARSIEESVSALATICRAGPGRPGRSVVDQTQGKLAAGRVGHVWLLLATWSAWSRSISPTTPSSQTVADPSAECDFASR